MAIVSEDVLEMLQRRLPLKPTDSAEYRAACASRRSQFIDAHLKKADPTPCDSCRFENTCRLPNGCTFYASWVNTGRWPADTPSPSIMFRLDESGERPLYRGRRAQEF